MKPTFDFEAEVIERSRKQAVLVDFWAEWCAPCRVLGPVLDKVVASMAGRVALVKVNTDEHPALAQKYRVSSIPQVSLFVGGAPVAQFVGALPESEVRRFLQANVPSPGKEAMAEARSLLARGQDEAARKALEVAVEGEPQLWEARVELAALELFRDRGRATSLVERVPLDDASYDRAEAIRELAELFGRTEGGLPEGAEPRPAWERYFAAARAGAGRDFAGAVEAWIELVRTNRKLDDEGPRRAVVALFRVLGDEHPITQEYRRALTSAMY